LTSERYYNNYGDYALYRPGTQRRPPRPEMQQTESARPRRAYAVQTGPGSARGSRPTNGGTQYGRNPGITPRRPQNGSQGPQRRPLEGAQPSQRRFDPSRRPPVRTQNRRKGIPLAVKLGIGAILLGVLIFIGVRMLNPVVEETGPEVFVNNVFVNGENLAGLTKEEGYSLMYAKRDQWLNTTYPLTYKDRTWNFTPASVNARLELDDSLDQAWSLGHIGDQASREEIITALQTSPASFTSEPTYDEAAIDQFVASIAREVQTEPVDAEITLTAKKPEITRASVNGTRLDEAALKANLIQLIETGKGDTQLPVIEIQPTVASDNMEMDIIATCETDTTFRGHPSRTNLRLALERFNLLAVYPGDVIKFNEVVGPRTEALGYQEAPEYAGSNKEMGIGGGVCQASTTLYNALLQAGMTITERHCHTMTVTYVDPSRDAAVNYGKKDLVFRNDTEHTIYIYTDVNKKRAQVIIYGTRPKYRYEIESWVLRENAESTKIGYQDDEEGDHVYYTTDPPVLYRKGRGSCESEGWLVAYDWETGNEVERTKLSHDVYSAGVNVYWRGVHDPNGDTPTSSPEPY